MEAFEEIRQVCLRARDMWPSVPGSHSDTEASDGLVLSLLAGACKKVGQQILDDVRAAYCTAGPVECCDVLPEASHGESVKRASSKESRKSKRKWKWEPQETPSKRARREH
ncbi:hypothetical protein MTO96_003249 [Rhipicephalus appendiculatus]